jgi:hypothetical protein
MHYIKANNDEPRVPARGRAKEVIMCKIAKEFVSFPFPELPGAPAAEGTITIHRDGGWTFETVEDGLALKYWVVWSAAEGGPLIVTSEVSGEVPPGEYRYYTGEYPRV